VRCELPFQESLRAKALGARVKILAPVHEVRAWAENHTGGIFPPPSRERGLCEADDEWRDGTKTQALANRRLEILQRGQLTRVRGTAARNLAQFACDLIDDQAAIEYLGQSPGQRESRCLMAGDENGENGVSNLLVVEWCSIFMGRGEQVVKYVCVDRGTLAAATGRDESEERIVEGVQLAEKRDDSRVGQAINRDQFHEYERVPLSPLGQEMLDFSLKKVKLWTSRQSQSGSQDDTESDAPHCR
jgi:hypothetical protein